MTRLLICIIFSMAMMASSHAQQAGQPGASSGDSHESVPLPGELDRVLRDYEKGWQARDAGALAALFSPDGFILRTGHPPVRGRAAIEEGYRNSGGPLHLRALKYGQADTVAYIIGAYSGGEGQPDSGKFILTLELMPDGLWYITADMDNLNM